MSLAYPLSTTSGGVTTPGCDCVFCSASLCMSHACWARFSQLLFCKNVTCRKHPTGRLWCNALRYTAEYGHFGYALGVVAIHTPDTPLHTSSTPQTDHSPGHASGDPEHAPAPFLNEAKWGRPFFFLRIHISAAARVPKIGPEWGRPKTDFLHPWPPVNKTNYSRKA